MFRQLIRRGLSVGLGLTGTGFMRDGPTADLVEDKFQILLPGTLMPPGRVSIELDFVLRQWYKLHQIVQTFVGDSSATPIANISAEINKNLLQSMTVTNLLGANGYVAGDLKIFSVAPTINKISPGEGLGGAGRRLAAGPPTLYDSEVLGLGPEQEYWDQWGEERGADDAEKYWDEPENEWEEQRRLRLGEDLERRREARRRLESSDDVLPPWERKDVAEDLTNQPAEFISLVDGSKLRRASVLQQKRFAKKSLYPGLHRGGPGSSSGSGTTGGTPASSFSEFAYGSSGHGRRLQQEGAATYFDMSAEFQLEIRATVKPRALANAPSFKEAVRLAVVNGRIFFAFSSRPRKSHAVFGGVSSFHTGLQDN